MFDSFFTLLALLHGGFYLATGVWPLVSIGSFQRVTGPKTDLWLVRTVGVIVAVIGATLCLAGLRDALSPEVLLLAIGTAAALTAVDVFYVLQRVISPVYLLDAVAEALLVVAWLGIATGYWG